MKSTHLLRKLLRSWSIFILLFLSLSGNAQNAPFAPAVDSFDYVFDDFISAVELADNKLFVGGQFKKSGRYSRTWVRTDSLGSKTGLLPEFSSISKIIPDTHGGMYIQGSIVGQYQKLAFPPSLFYMDSIGNLNIVMPEYDHSDFKLLQVYRDTLWLESKSNSIIKRKTHHAFFNLQDQSIQPLSIETSNEGLTGAFNLYDGSILLYDDVYIRINGKEFEHFARIDSNGQLMPFADSLGRDIEYLFQINDSLLGVKKNAAFNSDSSVFKILNTRTQHYLDFELKFQGVIYYASIYRDSVFIGGSFGIPNSTSKFTLGISPLNQVNLSAFVLQPEYSNDPVCRVGNRIYMIRKYESLFPISKTGLIGIDIQSGQIVDTLSIYGSSSKILPIGDTLFIAGNLTLHWDNTQRDLLVYSINQQKIIHQFDEYPSFTSIRNLQYSPSHLLLQGEFKDSISFDFGKWFCVFETDSLKYSNLRDSSGDALMTLPYSPRISLLNKSGNRILFSDIYSNADSCSQLVAYVPQQDTFLQFPGIEGDFNTLETYESDVYLGGRNLVYTPIGSMNGLIHLDKQTQLPTHSQSIVDKIVYRIEIADEDEVLLFGNFDVVFNEARKNFAYANIRGRKIYDLKNLPFTITHGTKLNHHLIFTGDFDYKVGTTNGQIHHNLTVCDTLGNPIIRPYSLPKNNTYINKTNFGAYFFHYTSSSPDSLYSTVLRMNDDFMMDTLNMQHITGYVGSVEAYGQDLIMLGQDIRTDISYIPNLQIFDIKTRRNIPHDIKVNGSVKVLEAKGDSLLVAGDFHQYLYASSSSAFILQPSTLTLVDTIPIAGLTNFGHLDDGYVYCNAYQPLLGFPQSGGGLHRYSLASKQVEKFIITPFTGSITFFLANDSLLFGSMFKDHFNQNDSNFLITIDKRTWQFKDSLHFGNTPTNTINAIMIGDSLLMNQYRADWNGLHLNSPYVFDQKLNFKGQPEMLKRFTFFNICNYNEKYWLNYGWDNVPSQLYKNILMRFDHSMQHEFAICDLNYGIQTTRVQGDYLFGKASYYSGYGIYLIYLKQNTISFFDPVDTLHICAGDTLLLHVETDIDYDSSNRFEIRLFDGEGQLVHWTSDYALKNNALRFVVPFHLNDSITYQVKLFAEWPRSTSNPLPLRVKNVNTQKPFVSDLYFCPGNQGFTFHFSDSAAVDSVIWEIDKNQILANSGSYTLNQTGDYPLRTLVYSNGCAMRHVDTLRFQTKPEMNLQTNTDAYLCDPYARISFKDEAKWPLNYERYSSANAGFSPVNLEDIYSPTAGTHLFIFRGTFAQACSNTDSILVNIQSTTKYAIENLTSDTQCYHGNTFQFIEAATNPAKKNQNWYIPSLGKYQGDTLNLILNQEREHRVYLLTEDENSCLDTSSSLLYIHPRTTHIPFVNPGYIYKGKTDTLRVEPDVYFNYSWRSFTDSILNVFDNKAVVQWVQNAGLKSIVRIWAQDSLGCATDTNSFYLDVFLTSIHSAPNHQVKIYPNPAEAGQSLVLENGMDPIQEITLIDPLGRTMPIPFEIYGSKYILNTKGIEPGVYVLRVKGANTSSVQVVIN